MPFDALDPVLTVDETRNNKIYCTVLKSARGTQLQGSLCCFDLLSNGSKQRVLGRIGIVDTTNPIHGNPVYAPLIMETGHVPYFSVDADVEKAVLEVLACVNDGTDQLTARRTNPPSSTLVFIASPDDVPRFLNDRDYYVTIGTLPNYPDVYFSLRNRSYGEMQEGGAGEGKHTFILGINGSAKTVLGQMKLAARACQHKEMGFLICDTKSDFCLDGKHDRPGVFAWSMKTALERGGREIIVIRGDNIRLTKASILQDLLVSHLIAPLNSTNQKTELLVQLILTQLLDDDWIIKDIRCWSLPLVLDIAKQKAGLVWSKADTPTKIEALDRIQQMPLHQKWWDEEVVPYFIGTYTPADLAKMALKEGAFLVLDIDLNYVIDNDHQDAIMQDLFHNITTLAKAASRTNQQINAEMVIDEAHRWIPEGRDKEGSCKAIIDAVNTTRAFKVGWTFISQRIASIQKDVLAQCHTKYYGRGLGVGADRKHLEDDLGAEGAALYDILDREAGLFFIAKGYDLNLGTGGVPMAFIPLGGDATSKLMHLNPHIWSASGW